MIGDDRVVDFERLAKIEQLAGGREIFLQRHRHREWFDGRSKLVNITRHAVTARIFGRAIDAIRIE